MDQFREAVSTMGTTQQTEAQAIGHAFHETLKVYLGEATHPEDPVHDEEVGKAILAFGEGQSGWDVAQTYNSWAVPNGYAPIRWLGHAGAAYPPGTELVDIQHAVLAVGRGGEFTVVRPPKAKPATGLRARLLPPAEWATALVGTALEGAPLDPALAFIIVVERDGQTIACWSAQSVPHVEGLWKHPDHREDLGVSRLLLQTMMDQLIAQGVQEVLTNADTAEVEALLEKVGGRPLPGRTWVIPIPGKEG